MAEEVIVGAVVSPHLTLFERLVLSAPECEPYAWKKVAPESVGIPMLTEPPDTSPLVRVWVRSVGEVIASADE